MAKFIKLDLNGKEYYIGFSCRASVLKAEDDGFLDTVMLVDKKPVYASAKILHYGLMEKQPGMTLDDCNNLIEEIAQYNIEHPNEVIRLGDLNEHILEAFYTFSGTPLNQKAKAKKLEIVEM